MRRIRPLVARSMPSVPRQPRPPRLAAMLAVVVALPAACGPTPAPGVPSAPSAPSTPGVPGTPGTPGAPDVAGAQVAPPAQVAPMPTPTPAPTVTTQHVTRDQGGAAVPAGFVPSTQPPRDAANVLLVSIDTLRADALDCYGYERPTAPQLRALAAQGALFEHVRATSDWTLPTHCSMFTGLYASSHRVETEQDCLDAARGTLGEELLARNYATAGFVTNPYLDARFGYARGMSVWAHPQVRTVEPAGSLAGSGAGFRTPLPRLRDKDYWFDQTSAWVADRGIEFLQQPGRSGPFFLFLHFNDVHADYIPPAPWDTLFDPDWNGDLVSEGYAHNPAIRAGMDQADLNHVRALYDGEIRAVDEQLGRVLAALDALRLTDSTLVMITADHGEGFFEHGEKEHRKGLFPELVNVPWIVRFPGRVSPGRRIAELASQVDLAPTILGLLGAGGLPEADGVDFSGVLRRDERPPLRDGVLSQCFIPAERDQPAVACFALHTPTFAVLVREPQGGAAPGSLVFDWQRDAGQQAPLSPDDPACRAALQQCAAVRARAREAGLALPRVGGIQPAPLEPALREQLDALGYAR